MGNCNHHIVTTDTKITYDNEMIMVAKGVMDSRKIVNIFEDYMNPIIVAKENTAHKTKTIWKWFTIVTGALGAIGFYGKMKSGENLRLRRKYYDY